MRAVRLHAPGGPGAKKYLFRAATERRKRFDFAIANVHGNIAGTADTERQILAVG